MDRSNRPTTLSQASRALGVPVPWLREEAEAGRLPCLRVGENRFVFDLEQLRGIIFERIRTGDAEGGSE